MADTALATLFSQHRDKMPAAVVTWLAFGVPILMYAIVRGASTRQP